MPIGYTCPLNPSMLVGSIRRILNDAILAKHPKRFGAIATLPGKTIDGSLSERRPRKGCAGHPSRSRPVN
jgi:hypothetical protein